MFQLTYFYYTLRDKAIERMNGVLVFILLGLILAGTVVWMESTDKVVKLLAIGWLALMAGVVVIKFYGYAIHKKR